MKDSLNIDRIYLEKQIGNTYDIFSLESVTPLAGSCKRWVRKAADLFQLTRLWTKTHL